MQQPFNASNLGTRLIGLGTITLFFPRLLKADDKTLIEVVNPSGVAIASLLHYEQTTILEIKEYLNNMMVSQ